MKPPVLIDCFAGAGGLSLGFRDAGFRLGSAFDFDARAVETYRRNLGDHALLADARSVTGHQLMDLAEVSSGEGVVVAGGPPCQGFSRQRRGGRFDLRNDLVFEFLRIALEIRPELIVMENVAAILGPRGRDYVGRFREVAIDAGYSVVTRVLDAADFGVPQRRRRAFVVAERNDKPASFLYPSPSHCHGEWVTVRVALDGLPEPTREGDDVIPNHRLGAVSELNRLRISFVPEGGGREDIPEEYRLQCHLVSVDTTGHRGVYGRLAWDRPAGTITTKCNSFTRGRFAHPESNRNITMREAARLQSFPDWFEFSSATVAAAHQIGNAVPPLLGCALGAAALGALDIRARAAPVPRQLALMLG